MRVLTFCILLLLTAQVTADSDNFQRCAAIGDDFARLFCYDSAAGRNATSEIPPAAPAATVVEPAAAAPPSAILPEQQPAAIKPAPREPEIARNEPAESEFGMEQVNTEKGGKTISSRYDGEFSGWTGRTIFKLENGQVWRQSQSGWFRTSMDRPMITIERGAFDSYRLKVEGLNRSIRVKRVR